MESRTASSPRAQEPEPAAAAPSATEDRPAGTGGGSTSAEPAAELPQRTVPERFTTGSGTEAEGGAGTVMSYPVGGLIREGAGEGVQYGALTRGSSATSLASLSQEQPAWLRSLSQPEPPVRPPGKLLQPHRGSCALTGYWFDHPCNGHRGVAQRHHAAARTVPDASMPEPAYDETFRDSLVIGDRCFAQGLRMRGRDDSALDRAALSETAAEVSSSKSGNGTHGSRQSSLKSEASGAI